jgi:hypothetical protein
MVDFNEKLKLFDLFSLPVRITYRKDQLFKTRIGGICSLLLIIISINYSYVLFNQVYYKEHSNVYEIMQYNSIAKSIDIYSDYSLSHENNTKSEVGTINIYFGISKNKVDGLLQLNSSYLYLSFKYIQENHVNNSRNLNIKEINHSICDNFKDLDSETINSLNLINSYCFNSSILLKGSPGINNSSYVKISLKQCRNNTIVGKVCVDQTSIDNYIDNLVFEIYYLSEYYDFNDKDKSVYVGLSQEYFLLTKGFKKESDMFITIDSLFSYESIFPSFLKGPTKIERATWVQLDEETLSYYDDEDGSMLDLYISSNKTFYIYSRYYLNVFNQIAILGGLAYALATFINLFIYFIIKHRLEEKIVNDLYTIIHPKKEKNLDKPFSVFLKERFNILAEIDNVSNSYEYIKSLMTQDEAVDKFFDKKRVCKILGLDPNLPLSNFERKGNSINTNYSPTTIKNFYTNGWEPNEEISSVRRLRDNNSRITYNIGDDNRSMDARTDRSIAYSMNFPNLNALEYHKYKIIYDILKFPTNDKMFYSIFEILIEAFCPCFANEKSKKKFKIYRTTLQKLGLDIDLFNIISAVNSFETLKGIFFGPEQKYLFDNISLTSVNDQISSEEMSTNKNNLISKELDDKSKDSQIVMFELQNSPTILKKQDTFRNKDVERLKRLENRHRASNVALEARKKMFYFDRKNKMKLDILLIIEFEAVMDDIIHKPVSETFRFLLEKAGLEQETITGFFQELKKKSKKYSLNSENEDKIMYSPERNRNNLYRSPVKDIEEEEKDRSFGI